MKWWKPTEKGPKKIACSSFSVKINVVIEHINHVSSSPMDYRPCCTLSQIEALNILLFSSSAHTVTHLLCFLYLCVIPLTELPIGYPLKLWQIVEHSACSHIFACCHFTSFAEDCTNLSWVFKNAFPFKGVCASRYNVDTMYDLWE